MLSFHYYYLYLCSNRVLPTLRSYSKADVVMLVCRHVMFVYELLLRIRKWENCCVLFTQRHSAVVDKSAECSHIHTPNENSPFITPLY